MPYTPIIENIITNPNYFSLLGFTIIRNVLDVNEVQALRHYIDDLFGYYSPQQKMLYPRHIVDVSRLYQLPFHPKIVPALKTIFGENYVQWGDFQVQRNMFGGWHTDCGSENLASYLFDNKHYRFAKCGLYFQDNNAQHGGGIDIGLWSHKFLFGSKNPIVRRFLHAGYGLIKKICQHPLKIHAGDLVCFDSRILHSSTLPQDMTLEKLGKYDVIDLPKAFTKYAMYWNVCNPVSQPGFIANSMRRSLMEEFIHNSQEIYFSDYMQRVFPSDYPTDFVEHIQKNALTMATLDTEKGTKFKDIYTKLLQTVE